MKVLVFGLPGAGKTTFVSQYLSENPNDSIEWFNADDIRKQFDDWDFSPEGRERQAKRMMELAYCSKKEHVIVDMVAPTEYIRGKYFDSFVKVWINTIEAGRFADTNKMFEKPIITPSIVVNSHEEFDHSLFLLKTIYLS